MERISGYILSYLHHDGSEIYWEEIFGVFAAKSMAKDEKHRLLGMQPYYSVKKDGPSLALYDDCFRIEPFAMNAKRKIRELQRSFDKRKDRFKKGRTHT